MRRRLLGLLISASAATGVQAAPPPPPPEYLFEAAKLLAHPLTAAAPAALSSLFAPDVRAYENGELVADGHEAWLSYLRRQTSRLPERVIGHAESSAGYGKGGGDLLVVDEIDTVDRTGLPPTFIADPRLKTRALLHQFGDDRLIHNVRITSAAGFWEAAR